MRQILLAGIAMLGIFGLLSLNGPGGSPWLAFADESKNPSDSPIARKLAEIKKQFEAEEMEIKKKLEDAKGGDDAEQAKFLLKERSALSASDAVELAAEDPKDEASAEAAVFALKLLGQHAIDGSDMDKASAILLENHVDNPKLQPALAQMSGAGPTGRKFLKAVAEKTSVDNTKALAWFYYGTALDDEIGKQQAQGNDVLAKRLQDEAVEAIDKAVKLAPELKVGTDTLAKAASAAVLSLKLGVDNPVPDVDGIDLDGKAVKLSSLKGKVVLFDFWATWCGPCRAMIPHEREMVGKLPETHFVMVSVNVDDAKDTLTEFLEKEKMPWQHWWEGPMGPLAKTFKVRAYPTIYLIDAKGIIRKHWIGSPGDEVLDKAVADLVAEAKKAKP